MGVELTKDSVDLGIVVRVGRYGTYVEEVETEKRANVADDLPPDELTLEVARDLLARPMGEERALGLDAESGHPIVARAGRFVSVDVHDDGPALTGADADRLFDRFAHRPQTTAPAPGAPQRAAPALGLFLVRETAARHGGTVAVMPTTSPDSGTALRLLLPIA